jgi:NodT family efflux transporter outer membrane factor (OMF) lipoprotein
MRKSSIILLATTVAGCAPQYAPPETHVAPAYQSATAPTFTPVAPPTDYWQALGDTALVRLVTEGVNANLDVVVASTRVRQARAARTQSVLDFAPTVTASGGYTRQRTSPASFGNQFTIPDLDLFSAGLDASWELDLFGRVRNTAAAQTALVGSAEQQLRNARVSLAAELARTYFDLRGAQAQLAFAAANAAAQKRTLDVVQQRLDAGRGTAFDTERAKAQLAATLANIPSLESRIASAQFRIGVLVGRPPASLVAELATPIPLPVLPASVAVGSPTDLVKQRPDVLSAERQFAAQQSLVNASVAEYLPKILLSGTGGFTSNTLGSLGGASTSRFAVGPVISWPALNLGRVKARADGARAVRDETKARYEQTVLQALSETESALVAYQKSRERLEYLRESAVASEKAEALARLRFEGGVADFLQVLDAERSLLDAQDRLAQGQTDATTSYVAVYKAIGGTWVADTTKK